MAVDAAAVTIRGMAGVSGVNVLAGDRVQFPGGLRPGRRRRRDGFGGELGYDFRQGRRAGAAGDGGGHGGEEPVNTATDTPQHWPGRVGGDGDAARQVANLAEGAPVGAAQPAVKGRGQTWPAIARRIRPTFSHTLEIGALPLSHKGRGQTWPAIAAANTPTLSHTPELGALPLSQPSPTRGEGFSELEKALIAGRAVLTRRGC